VVRVHCGAQVVVRVGLLLLLAACGGGGGGESSAPDLSTAPGLAVSPNTLAFSAVHNGAIPPTQNVQITISHPNAAFIGLGFPPGVNPPAWLDQSPSRFTGAGNNWTFTAAILSTSLAPGTYTTTIRTAIADVSQNILALRDVQLSYMIAASPITASPNLLNFSYVTGGAVPAAQTVTLMGDPAPWTASANQPWIGTTPSSGPGGGSVSVSVDPSGLAPNTYNGTITFTAAGNTATVNISLSVAVPVMQTSQDSLSFSGINGGTLPSQSLTITMNSGAAIDWTAATPPADTWLVLDRTSGTQADTLGVSVNPANGGLASGVYNSSISLQGSSGGSNFNKTVNVTMTLTKATLTVSPVSLTHGGSDGRDFSGVPVQLSLNTPANSFPWNSTASSFVQRSPSSGSVSAAPVSVTFTPDATGLSGGTHSGSVTFAAQVNGDPVSVNVPVTFNLESHKLLVDGNGVAFAKTPTLSKLTRTLKVRDNLGLATGWTASKTQPWLTITASGTAGDDLVLTADPTGLATDILYFDTVTIDSPDTGVENRGTEKVRVGFWVGSADPTANSISVTTANIAADPIRPYAYAAVGADIQVYNVFTGSLLTTITGVAAGGGTVGFMTVSHDGSKLYALDTSNPKIVPVDLDAQTAGTPFSVSLINPVRVIDYTRTNGVELIVSGSAGQILNAQTGTVFPSAFVGNTVVTASRGGSRLCTVNVGISLYSISCPSLDFTSLNGGQLLLGNAFEASGIGSNGADIAVNAAGTIAYVAAGAPAEISVYATNLLYGGQLVPADLHPSNVEIAADGRIFGAGPNLTDGPADVWVYAVNGLSGTLLTTRKVAVGGVTQVVPRHMRISGDGLRLIALVGDFPLNTNPVLVFTTVAP
jgi:hypothetical protein